MSSDSDNEIGTPPEIVEKANQAAHNLLPIMSRDRYEDAYRTFMDWSIAEKAKQAAPNLLPIKSRDRYEEAYRKFMEWRMKHKIKSFSENVVISYFDELSQTMKPSSLWAIYSMIRTTINIKHNIDISKHSKLIALLRRKSDGFKSKKSKIFTSQEINNFLKNSPDDKYLLMKVILIIGISGSCRKQELRNIKPCHIEDTGKSLIVKIPTSKTKTQRFFVVPEEFYQTCKKYINLRPLNMDNDQPFFLNYQNEKCTKQCVGINKIGSIAKQIAEYLHLPEANLYTGHCFRRSSATILVNSLSESSSSAVAEGYVDCSIKNQNDTRVNSEIEAELKASQSKKRRLQTSEEPAQLCSKQFEECDQQVVTWANILKTMDQEQKLYAKKFINDILYQGQLGALHKNSLVINCPVITQPSTSHANLLTFSDVTDFEQVWTSDDIESLISLVQIQKMLYDQTDPDYNISEMREQKWQHIGNKIKKTSESCSKKWQELYSEYKQRKKHKNMNEWSYFNSIDFLKDYLPEVSDDKSPSVDNLTAFHDVASFSRLSETPETYSRSHVSPEKVIINENTLSFGNIKIEIEDEDCNKFMEIQDHSGNDVSDDVESCSRLEMDYLDNDINSNCSLQEFESYSKAENDKTLKMDLMDLFKNGKCNSMELFLLSLANDCNSLNTNAQRKFKSITLQLVDILQY